MKSLVLICYETFINPTFSFLFSLRWLLQNKVPGDICNKVHIFSTFFYKRLTSKPKKTRRHHPTEDDPKLSKVLICYVCIQILC